MRKKKSLITKCSAAVMSLLMVAGSVGNYSIVYAANAFKAGDSFKIKYTHNNKISTEKSSGCKVEWQSIRHKNARIH